MKTSDFRKIWAGRTFRDKTTGTILTIPDNVRIGEVFRVGESAVNVGSSYNGVWWGNLEEIELFEDGEYVVLSSGGQGQ